jgi:hypothetical protein
MIKYLVAGKGILTDSASSVTSHLKSDPDLDEPDLTPTVMIAEKAPEMIHRDALDG